MSVDACDFSKLRVLSYLGPHLNPSGFLPLQSDLRGPVVGVGDVDGLVSCVSCGK